MQTKISVILSLFILFSCSTITPIDEAVTPIEEALPGTAAPPVIIFGPAVKRPAPCSAPEYRHFDFWIGEWTVTTPDGQYAGKNSIQPMLNGCALYESWTGSSGYRGDSVNFYDQVKNRWHQTWIDYAGNALYGNGGLVDDSMVLSGPGKNAKGIDIINRITWTPNQDGSVRQHWETSSDKGQTWATSFDGLYTKVKNE